MNCPTCGEPLEGRGPFDGTESSTGVSHGHEGFGDTFMCEQGHWWARIQGALIGPERILTVVEPSPPPNDGRPPYLAAGDQLHATLEDAAGLTHKMARVLIGLNLFGYDEFDEDLARDCRESATAALAAARRIVTALEAVNRFTSGL